MTLRLLPSLVRKPGVFHPGERVPVNRGGRLRTRLELRWHEMTRSLFPKRSVYLIYAQNGDTMMSTV